MKRLLLTLVLLWPVGAVGAVGAFVTGDVLQEFCLDTKPGESNAIVGLYSGCFMFLVGVANSAHALSSWGAKDKDGALNASCSPEGVTTEHLRQVWLNFAKAYPETLHKEASSLALNAFEQAWPCKR